MTIIKPEGEPSLWQELGTGLRRMAVPALIIAAVVVLLGLLITKVLDNSDLEHADAWVVRWLAKHHTETGIQVTHVGTLFAETPTIVGLTAITAGIFRAVFHRWRESVLLVLCVVLETLIFLLATVLIDRQRPGVPHLDAAPPTSSFPSGHTAAATAYYLGTALIIAWHTRQAWLKWLLVAVGVLVPIAVASSRLYRGMHYPTDTIMGFLLGLSLLAVAFRVLPLSERDRVDEPNLAYRRR